MKINIVINQDSTITIKGHATNEPCARVSTLAQTMSAIFGDKCISETSNGNTVLSFEKLTKNEQTNYEKFVSLFHDLKELYPNMITLYDEKEKITEQE